MMIVSYHPGSYDCSDVTYLREGDVVTIEY